MNLRKWSNLTKLQFLLLDDGETTTTDISVIMNTGELVSTASDYLYVLCQSLLLHCLI